MKQPIEPQAKSSENLTLKNKKDLIIREETSAEIIKKIQSNLNKLSEGNIDNIFSQIV